MRAFLILIFAITITSITYGQMTNRLDKLDVNDLNAKKLTVQSTTVASKPCPAMTEVQRDALTGMIEGQCVFNTTSKTLNVYDSASWVEVGAGGEGGISDWETAKLYQIGDIVIESTKIYQANTQHTSTSFASDIANWTLISGVVLDEATGVLNAELIGLGTVDNTELDALDGVASNIQDQLDSKGVEITGAASTIVTSDLATNKVAISNASGKVDVSSVTTTELGYLGGADSNIQDQIDAKEPTISVLPLSKGGSNKALSANNGGVVYSDSDSMEILAPGTSGQALVSNGAAAPSWQTITTEVSDNTFSGVLSLGKGGTSKSLAANNGAVAYSDADSLELLAPGVSGQILQSNGAVAPSFVNKSIGAKSENNSAVVAEEVQVPNNQLTQTASNKHLIESGNKNILVNPSFEHSTFSTGWTNSAGTFTEETVNEIHGLKAAKIVLLNQTMNLFQDSTLYAYQFADGVQGLVTAMIKSNVALKLCSRSAGVTSTSNCVDVQANNKYALYKVPVIFGATSNGLAIVSSGNVSGTVYVDDVFVGAVDVTADVDSSKVAGESSFNNAACEWVLNTSSLTSFNTNSTCAGPTVHYSAIGQWQTTDSDLPIQIINNLPAGVYKATFTAPSYMGVNGQATTFAINDGTTTCQQVQAMSNIGNIVGATTVSCVFKYSSSGNRSFQLVGRTSSGFAGVSTGNSWGSVKFNLEAYGSNSVYSTTNADFGWTSFTPTGGWASNTTYSGRYKRDGDTAHFEVAVSLSGAPTGDFSVNLPSGIVIDTAKIPITTRYRVGTATAYINTGGGTGRLLGDIFYNTTTSVGLTLTPPASSSSHYLLSANATSPVTWGSGDVITLKFSVPVVGWQNSNIIIGQFSGLEKCTDSYECESTFSAKVSAAGVVSDENIDWINGNASVSNTSTFAITFKPGLFTVAPNCTYSIAQSSNLTIFREVAATPSGISVRTYTPAGVNVAGAFDIICQKQGADYIGKTAKAVASDQNTRTPGVAKTILYSATIGTTGALDIEIGDFINGSCTNASPNVCTFNANTWSSSPVCMVTYSANANCSCRINATSSSSVSVDCKTMGSTILDCAAGTVKSIQCHGVSP